MDSLSVVSDGLLPGAGSSLLSSHYFSTIANGLSSVGSGPTPPADNITQATTAANTISTVPSMTLSQLNGLVSIQDPFGHTIVPSASGFVDLGNGAGQTIGTNNVLSLLGNNSMLSSALSSTGQQSFTGSDLRLIIETTQNSNSATSGRVTKQLVECHTISISSYRVKNPVRALGYTNPTGFSRGPRTIAGTMILTEMSVDALLPFLQATTITDKTMNSNITKTDQLPLFNITLVFANEEGAASYRTLYGVEFINDGTVYSVQDMLIEKTISWMALDFTPLLPLNVSDLFKSNILNASTLPLVKTPANLMTQPSNYVSI